MTPGVILIPLPRAKGDPMAKTAKKKPTKKSSAKKKPAVLHDKRFPNESAGYRGARDSLLKAEMGLRREIERVAALRRKLPPGGTIREDYVFEEIAADGQTRRVKLSELFGDKNSLIIYGFMYGPKMEKACPSCSSIIDALDLESKHISQRTSLVAVAKSPAERIERIRRERGWSRVRFLSSANNSFNRDYFTENENGNQVPVLNVFIRKNGAIHHFYATELAFAPADKGQHPRHVDMIWPLWDTLDYTPEGRGADWHPKLDYGA
jgi:predicted dithiol-disulfide oxidoreductase (DUF899 family)